MSSDGGGAHRGSSVAGAPIVIGAFLGLYLVKFGLHPIPNFFEAVVQLTRSPRGDLIRPFVEQHYLSGSWLGPAMFHLLGVERESTLFVLYSGTTIAALVLVMTMLVRQEAGFIPTVAAGAMLPFLPVVFHWVGYDSLLVLLFAMAFMLRHTALPLVVVGVFAGLQHAEVALLAGFQVAVFLVDTGSIRSAWRTWPARFLLGVGIGRALLEIVFRVLDVPSRSRTAEAVELLGSNLRTFGERCSLHSVGSCLPTGTLMVLLSLVWMLVPGLLVLRAVGRQDALRLLTCVAIAGVVGLFVLDQTRVGVLSLTFVSLQLATTSLGEPTRRPAVSRLSPTIFVVAWLLLPLPWVWEGDVSWYGWFDGLVAMWP